MGIVFVAAGAIYYIHAAEAGRWVVGPADPKTGERIRYRISQRYEKQPILEARIYQGVAEEYMYKDRTPPRYIRWLEAHHLFGRNTDAGRFGITFSASVEPQRSGWEVDKDGFVDIDTRHQGYSIFSIVSQEKRLIGGCPTTRIVEDQTIVNSLSRLPEESRCLVLHPRGANISYMFNTFGIKGERDNPDVQELTAIRDSVQIESRK
jgi:hypothetical protein